MSKLLSNVMNYYAVLAIYKFEMARMRRTLLQSIVTPVLTTSLYFIVFGAAIGSRIQEVGGVGYGAFIVPGLIMLSLLTNSISNASFGIYFPKFSGTVYEVLSAPVSTLEVVLGYVGAAATKAIILGLIILATAGFFIELRIAHPIYYACCLLCSPRCRLACSALFSVSGPTISRNCLLCQRLLSRRWFSLAAASTPPICCRPCGRASRS